MAENTLIKQRDSWFDNAKGFLMITVVVGHLLASAANRSIEFTFLLNFIYSFHMPAFALISGFFMKRRIDTKDYASVINKTIIPYCFAQLIIYIAAKLLPSGISALSAEIFQRPGTFSFAFPIYHLWYFIAVVLAFLFCIVSKAKEHPVRAFVISLIISLLCGAVPQLTFLKLTKTLAFLPFFVLGYLLPKQTMQRVKERKFTIPAIIFIVGVGVLFWFIKDEGIITGIFAMARRYDKFYGDVPYWAAVLIRLAYIIGSIIFTFAFLNICPKKKGPLTILGERSVYIYILHVIPIAVMRHFNYQHGILRIVNIPFMKVAYVLMGVLLCYVFVTKPVVNTFKKIFEPDFDIRKIPEYLKTEIKK